LKTYPKNPMKGKKRMDETVEFLRKSREQVGELEPVRITEDGRIIDGRHRLEAYPSWRKETVKKTPREAAVERIHRTVKSRVTRKERKAQILELALHLEEEGVKQEDMVSALAKEIPFSTRYIRSLLPAKYKMTQKARHLQNSVSQFSEPEGVPQPLGVKPDVDHDIELLPNVGDTVRRVLENPVAGDEEYNAALPRLTDPELKYCLTYETRNKGRQLLVQEWKVRERMRKEPPEGTLFCPHCKQPLKTVMCSNCWKDIGLEELLKEAKKGE
jgi:hypothetical protein